MFGKLFETMFDGTLYGHWEALVTLQQMVILSDADGLLDVTPHALAARTSIPLDVIQRGIEHLEKPDLYSRSSMHEGRRIVRIDESRPWGWRVVNKVYYRALASAEEKREADRKRIAAKRAVEKPQAEQSAISCDTLLLDATQSDINLKSGDMSHSSGECREMSPEVANVAYADADADADADKKLSPLPRTPKAIHETSEFHRKVIAVYHEILPGLASVKVWSKKRAQALNARIAERCRDGKPANTVEYWRDFFLTVQSSPHLTGNNDRGWMADLEWLLTEGNFAKVIEGRYAKRGNGGSHVG